MRPYFWNCRATTGCVFLKLVLITLFGFFLTSFCAAQDLKLNVTYVCNGERMYIDSCNIRDLSDTSQCMVGHPDRPLHNGFTAYTYESRGTLKKLLPTCTQPTAQQLAAADAFKKKQQAALDAATQKANPGVNLQANSQPNVARPQPSANNSFPPQMVAPPKNAEERAMRRCISSGRLPATCTGNSLLGAFGQMISQVLPSVAKEPAPGPEISGAYQGAGSWRLDFIDGGVLVNCSILSPNQESYSIDFKNNRAVLTINTRPKPLVLSLRSDGTITGPGPVTIDGVIASGTARSGPDPNASSGYTDKYGMSLSNQQAASSPEVYSGGQRQYGGAIPEAAPTPPSRRSASPVPRSTFPPRARQSVFRRCKPTSSNPCSMTAIKDRRRPRAFVCMASLPPPPASACSSFRSQ